MPVGWGSGFVLGVLGIFQPTPHVAHKRAALASWNTYVFLLLVVCHGGDLLTAAQLPSSFCIMETCLSWHPRINQPESLLRELCCHPMPVPIQDCKRESWLQTPLKWAFKPALTDVRISVHMITFWSRRDTLSVCSKVCRYFKNPPCLSSAFHV